VEDLLGIEPQRIEQRGDRQLAAAVDAGIDDVLGVELEVEPRAAIGNDARGEEQLAGECVLPLSWSKNTPGERCIWDTITRSVPLTTKVPLAVMSGMSPM
jgi:hypothetical protein